MHRDRRVEPIGPMGTANPGRWSNKWRRRQSRSWTASLSATIPKGQEPKSSASSAALLVNVFTSPPLGSSSLKHFLHYRQRAQKSRWAFNLRDMSKALQDHRLRIRRQSSQALGLIGCWTGDHLKAMEILTCIEF